VGLAIRLSILDIKLYTADLKCLVLDDMLLSLDMSNRDIVLNILLDKYADDYQLIMLTHDRYFFELTKGKINARNKSDSWIKWEMYEDFSNGKFNPLILKSKTNLERAKNFFKQKEFPASSNHMRKATENFVYEYVPKNKQYDRNFRPLDLSALIGKSRVVARANGLPMILIQNLDLMRTNIFNPGSHHDVYTPVFESELKKAIETLEEVSRLTGITL
jgi:wobble nucleotide-excising tRNase